MQHLFIINPVSFPLEGALDRFCCEVEECFKNGEEYRIYISRYPRDAIVAIHKYFDSVPKDEIVRVYAVGGDGILYDCLNGVAYFKNAELASIPYGKTNDFVRGFGENKFDLFRDIKKMSTAPTILTDAIKCGESYSICGCAVGVESSAVANVEKLTTTIRRYPRISAALPALFNLSGAVYILRNGEYAPKYRLYLDGKDYSGRYININGSNLGVNGGKNTINPYARPDDGELDAILAQSRKPHIMLRRIVSYTSGNFERHLDFFQHVRFKKMLLECDETMAVIIDGETYFTRKVEMEIIPKFIKIVAPAGEAYVGGKAEA